MANLGVVPLLRFAALRLAPIFLTLFFLTIVVRFVQEAMSNSNFNIKLLVNGKVCQKLLGFVKKLCNIFMTFCLLAFLSPDHGLSKSSKTEIWVLGKGEMREIPLKGKVEYAIGNKQVLKVKYLPGHHTLAIKAQAVGQTELTIWKKQQAKKMLIYVISKKEQLQSAQILHYLEGTGIEGMLRGDHVWAEGEIKRMFDLHRLAALKIFAKKQLYFEVTLHPKLQKQLRTEILQASFEHQVKLETCHLQNFDELRCFTSTQKISAPMKEAAARWGLKLIQQSDQDLEKNFQLKMRLVQFARTDGEEIKIGFEHFQGKVGELLKRPWEQILSVNESSLHSQNTQMQLMAEPTITMNVGEKQEFKIGQEFPYASGVNAQGTSQTDWKFAGLKINFKLMKQGDKLKLTYQTSHSQWDGVQIQGNEGKGSLFVTPQLKNGQILFQIPFEMKRKALKKMPLLGQIPLLGKLFQAPEYQVIKLQLWALIMLQES
jgi:hypothetical protein